VTLAALALSLALLLGHTGPEARAIASALARACGDNVTCVYDGAIYAEHESGWQLRPRAESWDARRGLAVGPWQLWGAPASLPDQARRWVALRAFSLAQYGDLRGLAGANDAGVRIARSRAVEASVLGQLVLAGQTVDLPEVGAEP
jgi:hypothetical protein